MPGITLGNVGVDASSQSCLVGNATGKTGTRQNGEFHFSHVEPTAMLWGVVELQLSGDGAGLFGRECLVERRWLVRVEIVQHLSLIHISSSWLNLVERFFRDLTDRITNGSFASVKELADTIIAYLADRNQNPKRYVWKAKGEEILRKIQRAREIMAQQQATA